jgi:hypothetical protein
MSCVRTDPLIVACSLCGQAPDQRCLRQSSYGTGAPLRRQHRERYQLARKELAARNRVVRAPRGQTG